MEMIGSVVTVTLVGSASGNGTPQTSAGSKNLSWTPVATATDLAGNGMSTTPRTETGAGDVDW
jgi:hypothetical protein